MESNLLLDAQSSIAQNFETALMKECKHSWNCEFSEGDVIEMEFTHLFIRVTCEHCGCSGHLDSDIVWKSEVWDDGDSEGSIT